MSLDYNTESVLEANTRCVFPFGENRGVAKPGKTSDFWLRLTRARERKGLSMDQNAIAKELSVFQSAVTKWKTGLSLPTLANAIKLAVDAGVCVDWLLTGREPELPNAPDDPDLSKLLTLWDKLTPELKQAVVDYAVFRRSTSSSISSNHIHELEQPYRRREAKNAAGKTRSAD